jgi:MFS transporter, SP family, sugar:H+ symporter
MAFGAGFGGKFISYSRIKTLMLFSVVACAGIGI